MRFFELSEFDCQETGKNEMHPDFLHRLDHLRKVCDFPFIITSGYRDPSHSVEAKKPVPGTHSQGIAADIRITNSADRFTIVDQAIYAGFSGIGIADGFVHLDIRDTTPRIWLY
jgi:zinc D-Ala-D-Ala carboxypeptidase